MFKLSNFGKTPSPRQFFGMSLYKSQIYVFGGYTNGNHLNDLHYYDLEQKQWFDIQTTGNTKPKTRQKLSQVTISKQLLILGGCNYIKNECFDDIWEFDLEKKSYTKIFEEKPTAISETQAVLLGKYLFILTSCRMMQNCQQIVQKLQTTFDYSADICNFNGIVKSSQCECIFGFYGNSCQFKNNCYFINCYQNQFCVQTENCKEICSKTQCQNDSTAAGQKKPCLNNCTSPNNGTCQFNGVCMCLPYWGGDDCSQPQVDISIISRKSK